MRTEIWLLTALVHRRGRQFRRNDVTCRKIKKRVEKINTVFNRREQCHSIVEQHVSQLRAHTFYSGIYFCQYSHMTFRHDRRIAKSEYCIRLSACLYVRPSAWNNSDPNWRIFMKYDIWIFFKNLSQKKYIQILLSSDKNNGCFSWRPVYIYDISLNPLKPELNSICYLLALLGAHHFLHVSRIRVNLLPFRLLMSYI